MKFGLVNVNSQAVDPGALAIGVGAGFDVSNAIAWLVSEEAPCATGIALPVHGGVLVI